MKYPLIRRRRTMVGIPHYEEGSLVMLYIDGKFILCRAGECFSCEDCYLNTLGLRCMDYSHANKLIPAEDVL